MPTSSILLSDALFYSAPPFYTGSEVAPSSELPWPFPIAIDGHTYIIDTKTYERATVVALRQAQDTSQEPGEQSLSTEGIWKRNAADWSLGAGDLYFDEEGSSRRRFHVSKGIDPWTKRRLCLLHETDQKLESMNSNLLMVHAGIYLYVTDDTAIRFTADPSADTPSWSTLAAGGGGWSSITTDGREIFLADGVDIRRATLGATAAPTVFSGDNADFVYYANGFLFAGVANVLNTYTAAATGTEAFTHFNVDFRYVAGAQSPKGVFIGGNSTTRGEFYFVGFDETTGLPAQATPAGQLNDGELIYAMTYYQGTMLLGTSRGFRLANLVSDRGIAPGPVIETPGAVRCLEPEAEYCWFGWSNYDTDSSGLGRVKLSEFTSQSVPAYASDLMAPAQGAVMGVATFDDRRYFSVATSGVWGEETTFVESGTIDSGWITYSIFERKHLALVDLHHEPLMGTIDVFIVTEDEEVRALGVSSDPLSSSPRGSFGGQGVQGERFQVRLVLNRDVDMPTEGPCLERWSTRCVVATLQADSIVVPILMYDTVDTMIAEGGDVHYDIFDEWQFLKGLESSRAIVTYQEGASSQQVTIREVSIKDVRGWNTNRDWLNGTIYVRMVTVGTGTGGS